MSAVFNKKNEDVDKLKQEHEDEKELLVKKIGEVTLDVDWLKKKQIQISQMKKKRALIDWKHPSLTIKKQCQLLMLSRSTAYHVPVDVSPSRDEINIKNAGWIVSGWRGTCLWRQTNPE